MNIINVGDPKTISLLAWQTVSVTTTGTITATCVSGLGLTAGATIGSIHGSTVFGSYPADGVIKLTATNRDGAYELNTDTTATIKSLTGVAGIDALDADGKVAVQSARTIALPTRAAALIAAPVFISGGRAVVGRTPKSLVPIDPKVERTIYYVDVTNGSDANDGSTWALAFKSIWKATTAGNTAAVPYKTKIAAGRYTRSNNFANASATVIPTQSCVFEAVGGQVECHTGGPLTWTLESGTTYQATRSNVNRCLDWLTFNSDGDYQELTLVASLVLCRATAGSWYTDNVTTYVNRSDGAAVTDTNTVALLTAVGGIEFTTTGSMHLYGITQIGGASAVLRLQNNGTGKFYAEDCKFIYTTGSSGINVVAGLDCGLAVFNRCTAAKGQRDGFNFHTQAAIVPKAVLFDCLGYENGTDSASTSNNGATIHDAGLLIDFNGRYYKNHGGDFAHANASTLAVGVCTHAVGSYGDVDRSGGVALAGTGFHSIDLASVYKYDCVGLDQITTAGTITVA